MPRFAYIQHPIPVPLRYVLLEGEETRGILTSLEFLALECTPIITILEDRKGLSESSAEHAFDPPLLADNVPRYLCRMLVVRVDRPRVDEG